MCEGWLEGYLLTGRHGFFASYEAFIRIVDSMAAQHAKWLKVCNQLSWRSVISSVSTVSSSMTMLSLSESGISSSSSPNKYCRASLEPAHLLFCTNLQNQFYPCMYHDNIINMIHKNSKDCINRINLTL